MLVRCAMGYYLGVGFAGLICLMVFALLLFDQFVAFR